MLTTSPAIVNDSLKYTDTQASVYWRREQLDLGAVLGFRVGDQMTTTNASAKSWASITALARITPRVGIVASGGTYPIDPTQGFPGGRFVSLALRLATNGSRSQPPPRGTDDDVRPETPLAGVTGFSAQRDKSGELTLRVVSPGARSVEITGDFTNWVPLQLATDSGAVGTWSVTLPINSGKYEMNIRIEGGFWTVPPGLLSMLDEFGGSVGLLVVQ